jgi:allantoinase
MTLPRERSKYSAIVDRPKLQLPNKERIIVWTVVNVEVWDIARPMPRQVLAPPTGVTTLPDVANWHAGWFLALSRAVRALGHPSDPID